MRMNTDGYDGYGDGNPDIIINISNSNMHGVNSGRGASGLLVLIICLGHRTRSAHSIMVGQRFVLTGMHEDGKPSVAVLDPPSRKGAVPSLTMFRMNE